MSEFSSWATPFTTGVLLLSDRMTTLWDPTACRSTSGTMSGFGNIRWESRVLTNASIECDTSLSSCAIDSCSWVRRVVRSNAEAAGSWICRNTSSWSDSTSICLLRFAIVSSSISQRRISFSSDARTSCMLARVFFATCWVEVMGLLFHTFDALFLVISFALTLRSSTSWWSLSANWWIISFANWICFCFSSSFCLISLLIESCFQCIVWAVRESLQCVPYECASILAFEWCCVTCDSCGCHRRVGSTSKRCDCNRSSRMAISRSHIARTSTSEYSHAPLAIYIRYFIFYRLVGVVADYS